MSPEDVPWCMSLRANPTQNSTIAPTSAVLRGRLVATTCGQTLAPELRTDERRGVQVQVSPPRALAMVSVTDFVPWTTLAGGLVVAWGRCPITAGKW